MSVALRLTPSTLRTAESVSASSFKNVIFNGSRCYSTAKTRVKDKRSLVTIPIANGHVLVFERNICGKIADRN